MQATVVPFGQRWASQTSLPSLRTLDCVSEARMRVDAASPSSVVAAGSSQPPRRERVCHQLPDSIPVERNDEKKIEFTGEVVNAADGGDDCARSVTVRHFQDR